MFTPIPSPEELDFLNKHVVKPADAFLDRHPLLKDGVIVAADVAGVIAGAVAVYTLVVAGGTVAVVVGLIATIVAGVACLFLLYEDGKHIWFTALHDQVGLTQLEAQPDYQWIQAIAPWFTLPDLAIGGRAVVREALEAGRKTGEVMSRGQALGDRHSFQRARGTSSIIRSRTGLAHHQSGSSRSGSTCQ